MADSESLPKNIGLTGSFSLIFGAITGPGLVIIPYVFQQAGWFLTLTVFLFVSVLTCLAGLFLIEAMSKYPENAGFQRNVELTTLVYHFYGRKWHNVMQACLYLSMQSINISSIVISAQTIDNFLVATSKYSCGFQLAPKLDWVCVYEKSNLSSPFPGIMLFTYGFLLLIVVIFPLMMLDLNDSVVIQFVSTIVVSSIMFSWIIRFFEGGLITHIPVIGPDVTQCVGNVMMNYAFVTTVPSWMAVKHPRVNTHRAVFTSIGAATFVYIVVGFLGGGFRPMEEGVNILSILKDPAANLLFPFFSMITTIPVYVIIVRNNLVQAKVCGRGWAVFWAAAFPIIISIPFQTGGYINTFMAYTTLIFTSLSNFVAPFMIYIFMDQRQSDDLITKMGMEEETEGDETSAAADFRVSMEINMLRNEKSAHSMQGSRMLGGSTMGLGGSTMLRGSNINFFNPGSSAGGSGGKNMLDDAKGLTLAGIAAARSKDKSASFMGGAQGILSNNTMSFGKGLDGKKNSSGSNHNVHQKHDSNNKLYDKGEFKSNRTADDSDFSLTEDQSTSEKAPVEARRGSDGIRQIPLEVAERIMSMSSLPSLHAKVSKLLSQDKLNEIERNVEEVERPQSRQIERGYSPSKDYSDSQHEDPIVSIDDQPAANTGMQMESLENLDNQTSDPLPSNAVRWKENQYHSKESLPNAVSEPNVAGSNGSLQKESKPSNPSLNQSSKSGSVRQIPSMVVTDEARTESIPILKFSDHDDEESGKDEEAAVGFPSKLPPLSKKENQDQNFGDGFSISVVSPNNEATPVLHSKESFAMQAAAQKPIPAPKEIVVVPNIPSKSVVPTKSAVKEKLKDEEDDEPMVSPREAGGGMILKKRTTRSMARTQTSVRNFQRVAPGFFVDPYYDERTDFYGDLPILDSSLLNKVPEGQKMFQALPSNWPSRKVAMISMSILSFLIVLVIITDIIQAIIEATQPATVV